MPMRDDVSGNTRRPALAAPSENRQSSATTTVTPPKRARCPASTALWAIDAALARRAPVREARIDAGLRHGDRGTAGAARLPAAAVYEQLRARVQAAGCTTAEDRGHACRLDDIHLHQPE